MQVVQVISITFLIEEKNGIKGIYGIELHALHTPPLHTLKKGAGQQLRRKIERIIDSVKGIPELITEFDESLWAGLVDSMTVHSKDRIVFRLTCGMEIEV